MMRYRLIVVFVLMQLGLKSQSINRVDSVVKTYPSSFKHPKKLSAKINEDFKTETDKARAIYTWIALNIKYDVEHRRTSAFTYNSQSDRVAKQLEYFDRVSNETLKKGKGVCDGYASLFWKICTLSGIESEIVTGNAKIGVEDIGNKYRSHAWNALKIENKWYLVDVTWGAGVVDVKSKRYHSQFSDIYFLTHPDLFFLNHFPANSRWLLTNKKSSDFFQLPLYHKPYLSLKVEIEKPLTGIVKINKDEELEFKMKFQHDPVELSYKFGKEKFSTEVDFQKENDVVTFKITVSPETNDYLTLYFNTEPMVTYRIQIQ